MTYAISMLEFMEILFLSIWLYCKMVICLKMLYILSFAYKVLLYLLDQTC